MQFLNVKKKFSNYYRNMNQSVRLFLWIFLSVIVLNSVFSAESKLPDVCNQENKEKFKLEDCKNLCKEQTHINEEYCRTLTEWKGNVTTEKSLTVAENNTTPMEAATETGPSQNSTAPLLKASALFLSLYSFLYICY